MIPETTTNGIFVTGTDTGVGKTEISCRIVRELLHSGRSVGAFKPACSGSYRDPQGVERWDDVERLAAALGDRVSRDRICPQCFRQPLAPPLSAAAESRSVDLGSIQAGIRDWSQTIPYLVIEGAGGWLCPLTQDQTFADVVEEWKLPVLIVARRGLGTINHTLLTVESIRRRRLPIAGVILNESVPDVGTDESVASNATEIEARTGIPVLGELRYGASELRRDGRAVRINWHLLMGPLNVPG